MIIAFADGTTLDVNSFSDENLEKGILSFTVITSDYVTVYNSFTDITKIQTITIRQDIYNGYVKLKRFSSSLFDDGGEPTGLIKIVVELSYNGLDTQISAMSQNIENMNTEIDNINIDMATMTTDIGTSKADIININNDIDGINIDTANIVDTIDNLLTEVIPQLIAESGGL